MRREIVTANAGPMADIAFLLLVFFLVSTTMNGEKGIQRKMPPLDQVSTSKPNAKRNTLLVWVNSKDELMVNHSLLEIALLKKEVSRFVNNNGSEECDYCYTGEMNPTLSDHPRKAIIALDIQDGASYDMYVQVQNEISAALGELREQYAQEVHGIPFNDLSVSAKREVRSKYPLLLSEQMVNLN